MLFYSNVSVVSVRFTLAIEDVLTSLKGVQFLFQKRDCEMVRNFCFDFLTCRSIDRSQSTR